MDGVRARKCHSAIRQRESARKMSVWLQKMYHAYFAPFSFKVGTAKSLVEATLKRRGCSTVRIELWRARIRTGCYKVNGQALAACILIKEAHFFQL